MFVASGRPTHEGQTPLRDHSIWTSVRDGEAGPPRAAPVSGQRRPARQLSFGQRKAPCTSSAKEMVALATETSTGRAGWTAYPEVENFGVPINSPDHEVDPFIAPDESYLIFCSDRPGGYGKDDFYIVFAEKDGGWTAPLNMGDW